MLLHYENLISYGYGMLAVRQDEDTRDQYPIYHVGLLRIINNLRDMRRSTENVVSTSHMLQQAHAGFAFHAFIRFHTLFQDNILAVKPGMVKWDSIDKRQDFHHASATQSFG